MHNSWRSYPSPRKTITERFCAGELGPKRPHQRPHTPPDFSRGSSTARGRNGHSGRSPSKGVFGTVGDDQQTQQAGFKAAIQNRTDDRTAPSSTHETFGMLLEPCKSVLGVSPWAATNKRACGRTVSFENLPVVHPSCILSRGALLFDPSSIPPLSCSLTCSFPAQQ